MSAPILLVLRITLTAMLYAFLGGALYLLWQSLKRQSEQLTAIAAPQIGLRQTEEDGDYRFTQAEVLIGRDPSCDCQLDDKTVSTQHARLSYHHNQWWLEDLGSRNGTFLNGEAIDGQMIVTSGDVMRCGQVTLEVEIVSSQ